MFTDRLLALLMIFCQALSFGVVVSYITGMLDFLERMDIVKSRLCVVEFGMALCNDDV